MKKIAIIVTILVGIGITLLIIEEHRIVKNRIEPLGRARLNECRLKR